MIPQDIVAFAAKPLALHLGTQDGHRQPRINRALGPIGFFPDDQMVFHMSRQNSAGALANLGAHGRLALVVGDIATFETYQFKGRFVEAIPCDAAAQAAVDAYIDGFLNAAHKIGHPPDLMQLWATATQYQSCLAVCFQVEQIFHQTPGPGTGEALPSQ